MRWRFGLGLAGLVLAGFIAGALVRAPADLILGRLAQRAGPAVTLVGPRGTVWDGRADALAVAGYRAQAPRWQVAPAALLTGTVRVTGRYGDGRHGGAGTLVVRPLAGRAALRTARARVPAAVVNRQLGDVLAVPLGGRFSLDLARLAAKRADGMTVTAADGTVTWRNAGLKLGERLRLGTLQAKLAPGPDGGLKARLSDRGNGPLAVDGQLSLRPDGAIRIDARLRARDSAGSRLKQGVAALGQPAEGGGRRVRFTGRLALP